jgi:hypothetical protein
MAADAACQTPQGMFLSWNTQPGLTYQVQVKTKPRGGVEQSGFAAVCGGHGDSIYVGGSPAGYYRVVFLY